MNDTQATDPGRPRPIPPPPDARPTRSGRSRTRRPRGTRAGQAAAVAQRKGAGMRETDARPSAFDWIKGAAGEPEPARWDVEGEFWALLGTEKGQAESAVTVLGPVQEGRMQGVGR